MTLAAEDNKSSKNQKGDITCTLPFSPRGLVI